jgi:hypothetical protein
MPKSSALAAGIKAVAKANGKPQTPVAHASVAKIKTSKIEVASDNAAAIGKPSLEVLIGAHFPIEVRCALLSVQATPENARKNLKTLLGEAINLLCAKYGKPQPVGDL